MKKFRALVLGLAVAIALLSTGCATTEDQNMSERPWNAPKSWEHGMPTGMMPQR